AEPGGPGAEDVAASARSWLSRSAERALSLGSPDLALTYAEEALSLATDADRALLLSQAARAATNSGDLHRASPLVADAVHGYWAAGDGVSAALLLLDVIRPFIGTSESPAVEPL